MCSTPSLARMASSAGTNSSATVQHRQPLASSTMFSSGQAALPQPLRISPSMPTSPNSLTMTASRRPCALARTWRISVVLPAPRKPVTMVQGTRASGAVHRSVSSKSRGGTRAIKPRLSISGRPRHGRMPSAARGKKPRAFDQARPRMRHRARRTHRSTSRCSAWRRSDRASNWQGSAAAAPRLPFRPPRVRSPRREARRGAARSSGSPARLQVMQT